MTTDQQRLERLGELEEKDLLLQLIMNYSPDDSDEIESVVFPVWEGENLKKVGEVEAAGVVLPILEVTLQFVPNNSFYSFLEKVLK